MIIEWKKEEREELIMTQGGKLESEAEMKRAIESRYRSRLMIEGGEKMN